MKQLAHGQIIGIVGPYPPFRGGIAHFTAHFHSYLKVKVTSVIGVSFSRQYPAWLFPGTSQFSDSDSTDLDVLQLVDSINPLSWNKAADYLVKAGVNEVVFMIWMPFFAPSYLGMIRKLRGHGIRITAVVHNASPHKKQPFGELFTRILLNKCDRVIALSETVKRDILGLGLRKDRKASGDVGSGHAPEVLLHPVYNQFGDLVGKKEARRYLGLNQDGPSILFFGLVRSYKGLDVLLRAFAETDAAIQLVVAGEWYEDHDLLGKLMRDSRVSSRVTCHNSYIPDHEIKYYFSAADVLVQPYRSATQSGVVQMARHFNLPSIVTNVGGLPEMVQHEVDGFVVPSENPGLLAEAINRFFSDDNQTRMSKATEERKAESTWEIFVDRFLNV